MRPGLRRWSPRRAAEPDEPGSVDRTWYPAPSSAVRTARLVATRGGRRGDDDATSGWAAFWGRGGFWRATLLVLLYVALHLGAGALSGAVGGDRIDTDDLFSSASSVFFALTIPLVVGSVVLAVFLASLRWWRPVFLPRAVPARRWMWLAPALVAIPAVLRLGVADRAARAVRSHSVPGPRRDRHVHEPVRQHVPDPRGPVQRLLHRVRTRGSSPRAEDRAYRRVSRGISPSVGERRAPTSVRSTGPRSRRR